jgi:antitoxin component of RelBE/YafQ-DinJ toxin-antitoxin module
LMQHMCYLSDMMDTTIRELDEEVYRQAKAKAALMGISIGRAVNEALRKWIAEGDEPKKQSILGLKPKRFGKENEHLSEEIDKVLYGA